MFFMCEYARSHVDGDDAAAGRATGRCEIAESYVARVETGPDGRATGVAYFDSRKRLQRQRARAVVLCANGAETPRLLLNSASSRFPNGLANSSGVVGKHLMFNTYFGVNAQFEHPLNEYKSVQNTRIVMDFYDTDPRRGFYSGAGSTAVRQVPDHVRARRPPAGIARRGEKASRAASPSNITHDVLRPHGTSLPLESNSVALDPSLKDAWGLPCMRVTYTDHPDDLKCGQFLTSQALQIAQAPSRSRRRPSIRRPHQSTCLARAEWATSPQRQSSIAITARTTYGTSSSATAAAWSLLVVGSRRRPSRRSPSARAN
jgi:hypothetical protein